jgi:hypothetical protein
MLLPLAEEDSGLWLSLRNTDPQTAAGSFRVDLSTIAFFFRNDYQVVVRDESPQPRSDGDTRRWTGDD